MLSKVKKKIIYSDNGRDIALTGHILSEDDFFLEFISEAGSVYRIGKKAIVCIKNRGEK
jgi:hypothetical protein